MRPSRLPTAIGRALRAGLLVTLCVFSRTGPAFAQTPHKFFDTHCVACHDTETKSGGLDLTALPFKPADADNFARWVKVHDRIAAGEMPPKKSPARPPRTSPP